MTIATNSQLSYIRSLIMGRFKSIGDAMVEYGCDMPTPANLTSYDASGMIAWLKGPTATTDDLANAQSAVAARVQQAAEHQAQAATDRADRDAVQARVDAIMAERGLSGLTGQARRDARYAINKELKGA